MYIDRLWRWPTLRVNPITRQPCSCTGAEWVNYKSLNVSDLSSDGIGPGGGAGRGRKGTAVSTINRFFRGEGK